MSLRALCAYLLLGLAACAEPDGDEAAVGHPWPHLTTVAFDPSTGRTAPLSLPQSQGRVALRVSGDPDTCLQVTGAQDTSGVDLAKPFVGPECRDCAWRTSLIVDTGVLVLEGRAEGLSSIAFGQVDCRTMAGIAAPGEVKIERLVTAPPGNPSIALRLVTSSDVDAPRLSEDIERELSGLSVEVESSMSVAQTDLLLDGRSDIAALTAFVSALPPRDEGVIDVVVGPCVIRESPFATNHLAGLTPRIPGGAGPADAVFVSRQTCGRRNDSPDRPEVVARVVAHELGHYLGLFHPEEADGTEDEFADTTSENLMHRFPLLRSAEGLSEAQYARLTAHPYVR